MTSAFKDLPLWTPCASIALAFCWLLPNANPPWLAFHKDAWVSLVLCAVAIVYLVKELRGQAIVSMEPISMVLVAMAASAIAQWCFGKVYFLGDAVLGGLYFLSAAICLMVAGSWERSRPGAVGDLIFTATLIAALATTGMMAVQWLRLEVLQVWIQGIPAWGRPYGNLVQPNNAATLLILGVISLAWFVHERRLRVSIAWASAAYLVGFLAISGSRSGYVSFVALAVVGTLMLWKRRGCQVLRWCGISLVVLLLIEIILLNQHWASSGVVSVPTGESALQRDLTSARLQIYQVYLLGLMDAPWTGYGFNQTILAQISLGAKEHFLPGLVTWSHNAFLDLALWFGIPHALFAMFIFAFVAKRMLQMPFHARRVLYLAGVFCVGFHGMVELPLSYAYFLFPTAMLAGAMVSDVKLPTVKLRKAVLLGIVITAGVVLSAIWYDYLRIESSFYAWRFKQNRIGVNHSAEVPKTLVLNQMEALLVGLHSETMPNDIQVKDFRHAVLRHPSAAAIQHLAEIQVRRGDIQAAQEAANIGWLISDRKTRLALAMRWQYLATLNPSFNAVSWPGE